MSWQKQAGTPTTSRFGDAPTWLFRKSGARSASCSAPRAWGARGSSTTWSSSTSVLAWVGLEGHRLDREAEGVGELVHRIVGQLHRLEVRITALRGDEGLGRVLGVPGDDRVGRHAGHLPADRKAIGLVDDRVHGLPLAGRIYLMWRCGNKAR